MKKFISLFMTIVIMLTAAQSSLVDIYNVAEAADPYSVPVRLMALDADDGTKWAVHQSPIVNITGAGRYPITLNISPSRVNFAKLTLSADGSDIEGNKYNGANKAPSELQGASVTFEHIKINSIAVENIITPQTLVSPWCGTPFGGYAHIEIWNAWDTEKRYLPGVTTVTVGADSADGFKLSSGTPIQTISLEIVVDCGYLPPQVAARTHGSISANLTAAELVGKMGTGWNLGNTFDSYMSDGNYPAGYALNTPISQLEMLWITGSQNISTQTLINGVKAAGFDTIRIPVTWYKVADPNNNWKIRTDWLDRVQSVVNMAYNQNMYVIINIHHDDYIMRPSNSSAGETAVTALWTQIAERFRNYDEKLIFEGLNEPRHRKNENAWNLSDGINWKEADWDWEGDSTYYNAINRWNQAFVNVVRASGGNNANRILMVPTYAAQSGGTQLDAFRVPTDLSQHRVTMTPTTANNNTIGNNNNGTGNNISSKKIALSVHDYIPTEFTLKSNTASWNKTDISTALNRIKTRADTLGVPVILGEWGVTNNDKITPNTRTTVRANYSAYYMEEATKLGMRAVLWDNGESPNKTGRESLGFINRQMGVPYYPEIFEAIMKERNPAVPVQLMIMDTRPGSDWSEAFKGSTVNITGNGSYTTTLSVSGTLPTLLPMLSINAENTKFGNESSAIGNNARTAPPIYANAKVDIDTVRINGTSYSLTNNAKNIPLLADWEPRKGYATVDIWSAWGGAGNQRLTGVSTTLVDGVAGQRAMNFSSGVSNVQVTFTVSGIQPRTSYTEYTNQTTLTSGWYYVKGTRTPPSRITINGDVKILLMDGAHLNAVNGGINVSNGNSLTVYSQSTGANMGKLTAISGDWNAGIGGNHWESSGTIIINGGLINAKCDGICGAGIGGGGDESSGSTITISNGVVISHGGGWAAGIGGGIRGPGGTITINGGTIESFGGERAFGPGGSGINGTVRVYESYDFITNIYQDNPTANRQTGFATYNGTITSINSRALNDLEYIKLSLHTTHLSSTSDCTKCTCGITILGKNHAFTADRQSAGASGHNFKCTNCTTRGGLTAHTANNQAAVNSNCMVNLVCACGYVMKSGNTSHTLQIGDCTKCQNCTAIFVKCGICINCNPQTTPSVPQNFTATVGSTSPSGNCSVLLSWSAPTSDGGSQISRYEVSKDNGLTWETVLDNVSGLPSHTATRHSFGGLPLAEAVQAVFKVRAVNSAGSGAENATTAVPRELPSAPQELTAKPWFDEIFIYWEEPASGIEYLSHYEVSKDNGLTWVVADYFSTEYKYGSHSFTGLEARKSYTFKVRAVTFINGAEGEEAAVTAMPFEDFPTAPRNFKAVLDGGVVKLSWSYPEDDGGFPITEYQIGCKYTCDCEWGCELCDDSYIGQMLGSGVTEYTFSELDNGINYTFYVRAFNNTIDDGGESATTTATPITPNICISDVNISENGGWIELHNPTGSTISTKGLYISNDDDNLYLWQMPCVIIRPDDTVRVILMSNNVDKTIKRLRTNFDLDVGRRVRLTDASGGVVSVVEVI